MNPGKSSNQQLVRLARRLETVGLLLLILALGGVVLAWLLPVREDMTSDLADRSRALQPIPALVKDTNEVVGLAARRELIRPPQVIASVKDDGRANRLLGQLKLQGILQVGDVMQAYISVQGQGVISAREGSTVLEFTVIKIQPTGAVRLSLDGVEVTLTH